MATLTREDLSDLMSGRLPWPRTKRIMSAFKDEDRFFKMIAILQERVAWQERILLPLGEHLHVVDKGGEWVSKCSCGQEFGDYLQNWKLSALIRVRKDKASLEEIYPHADVCDPDWMEIREFICPGCATLLEVEACAPGYPVVHDFLPDVEGFYREWLGRPIR